MAAFKGVSEKFRLTLANPDGSSERTTVQLGLDGLKLLNAEGTLTKRSYELSHISRWQATSGSLVLYTKTPVDVEERQLTLKGDDHIVQSTLDSLTCCCMQLSEVLQSGRSPGDLETANNLHGLVTGGGKQSKPSSLPTAGSIAFHRQPEKTGWLQSQGDHVGLWRKRWFVLKQGHLFRFWDDRVVEASKPRGIVDLSKVQDVRDGRSVTGKPNSIQLKTSAGSSVCYVADTETEMVEWMSALEGEVHRIAKHLAGVEDAPAPAPKRPAASSSLSSGPSWGGGSGGSGNMVNIVGYNSNNSQGGGGGGGGQGGGGGRYPTNFDSMTVDVSQIAGAMRGPDSGDYYGAGNGGGEYPRAPVLDDRSYYRGQGDYQRGGGNGNAYPTFSMAPSSSSRQPGDYQQVAAHQQYGGGGQQHQHQQQQQQYIGDQPGSSAHHSYGSQQGCGGGAANQPYGQGYGQPSPMVSVIDQLPVQQPEYSVQPTVSQALVCHSQPPRTPATQGGAWQAVHTPEGQLYYYNQQSGHTQWEKPHEMDQPPAQQPVMQAPGGADSSAPMFVDGQSVPRTSGVQGGLWRPVHTPEGQVYYHHLQSDQTQWERPPGM